MGAARRKKLAGYVPAQKAQPVHTEMTPRPRGVVLTGSGRRRDITLLAATTIAMTSDYSLFPGFQEKPRSLAHELRQIVRDHNV